MKVRPVPPPSDSSPATGWFGFAGLGVGFLIVKFFSISPTNGLPILLLFSFAPMWFWERRLTAEKDHFAMPSFASPAQIKYNFSTFVSALIIWVPIVGFARITSGGSVSGFFDLIIDWWQILAGIWVVWIATSKNDGVAGSGLGNLYLFLTRRTVHPPTWLLVRVQIIKAFFLPLMLTGAYGWLARSDLGAAGGQGPAWFVKCFVIAYLIDIVFGTIGYTTTSKATGAHVRSTEKTFVGWGAALVCYPPFNGWLLATGVTAYNNPQYRWYDWLSHSAIWTAIFGTVIVLLTAIYAWATISFGLRFSNLTHRGIVTCGPYRFSKHPAYICKNLSWWLIAIPFVPVLDIKTAVLSCCSLLLVNIFYYIRAKTEERHLLIDPKYQEYAEWISEHGIFARLKHGVMFFLPFDRKSYE